jgi:hypothetical protein
MSHEGDVISKLARAVANRDHFRRPWRGQNPGTHKEWLHFAIYGANVDVLVNFSVVDDTRARAPLGSELARITCLVRERAWEGDVDLWPSHEVVVTGGHIGLEFGPNHVRFIDGAYHIRAALQRRPVELELVLEPLVYPTEANNIDVEDGAPINWMVLPRLRASGVVRVAGRSHAIVDAPAYHDHNWGNFEWGRDFAWEWGYALPREASTPWSLVLVRLTDRGHRSSLMQGIFLWMGERKERVFRDDEVTIRHEGLLRPSSVFKIPRVMGLLSPGTATDVPQRLLVEGRSGDDFVRFEFTSEEVAQVVIPNDIDLGFTVINEVSGSARMEGVVRGRTIDVNGRSMCEFLGA